MVTSVSKLFADRPENTRISIHSEAKSGHLKTASQATIAHKRYPCPHFNLCGGEEFLILERGKKHEDGDS
jgi:hypothetical protein